MTRPFCVLAVTEDQPDGTAETISYIPLDVRERGALELSAEISENPVEAGSRIADHVIKGAVRYSLAGLVSDTPVGVAYTAPADAERGIPGTRALSCYRALKLAWDKSSPLTLIVELGVFDDMQIERLSFPRDADRGGNAVWFELDLHQVTVVESESATLPRDVAGRLKRRRPVTQRKLSTRQTEQAARRAKEVAAGKVSTETPTTAQSTSASTTGSAYAAASGGSRG